MDTSPVELHGYSKSSSIGAQVLSSLVQHELCSVESLKSHPVAPFVE